MLLSLRMPFFFRIVSNVMIGMAGFMYAPSVYSAVGCDYTDTKLKDTVARDKSIVDVERIVVQSPVGTVPRLPYQIWVTYSNGQSEYRQVKWSNYSVVTEEEQVEYPIGKEYRIKGYVLGENMTLNGYPVFANIKVVDKKYSVPSGSLKAYPLPLNKVSLIGDNRLTSNRDLAIDEIISWDVTQQLYNYRDTYGYDTGGYKRADGWDAPDIKLKGHGSGHYMSALAFAYACCQDESKKEILRKNIIRMVNELRECQERTFVWNEKLGRYWEARDFAPENELREMKGTWKDFDVYKTQYKQYGYGYLNAIPAHHPALIIEYRAYNNNDWVWAPYYSIHKQLAGLIDIATYFDDKKIADKALLIAKDMGLWVWNRLHYRTFVSSEGTPEERRAKPGNRYEMWNMYIAGEVGGMSESLARLSEMVKDSVDKSRLLEASNYFDSPAFYQPLSNNIDAIRTRHANQHIPMIVGALRSYISNQNPYYYNLAENFWNLVQGRYRYASGGVGNGEMFRQPYSQMLSMATNVTSDRDGNLYPSPNINETCCSYNLAKLSKDLNCYNPDNAQYMDYYERVLYNHIVGSLHPTRYMTTYHYAVGLDASKQWGNETPQSSCCGGTGSENHVKYQEAVYFVSDNTIWVGLYMPTVAQWDDKNVKIIQECTWPAEKSTIRILEGKGRFSMKLRVPFWATKGFDVKLNGKSISSSYRPQSYVEIPEREWTTSDVVEVVMPFTKYIDFCPDKMETAATSKNETKTPFAPMWAGTLMYGPLAMTATGITQWKDATINLNSDLSNIILNGASEGKGYEANVYSLSCNGIKFLPDYYTDKHSTHYFRINFLGDQSKEYKKKLLNQINEAKCYKAKYYKKTSFERLLLSISEAETLYNANVVSLNETNSMIEELDAAVAGLESKRLHKAELKRLCISANEIQSAPYTWDSYDNFQKALKAAEEVLITGKQQKDIDLAEYKLTMAQKSLVLLEDIDKSELKELMLLASERIKNQEAWEAMPVKVPEFSPWARHGYERLLKQYDISVKVFNNEDKRYNQNEVNEAVSQLNASINTMRPGNLAELEDLNNLMSMIAKVKEISSDNPELKEIIEYAEMVVKYVSDGSGTIDMIRNAEERLRLLEK